MNHPRESVSAPAAGAAMPSTLHATLNDAQRAAVLHGTGEGADDGPLLVIAGAGSGKTNTLAHRVAHLVASGADPGRILLLTFSRRAAEEMTRRVARILAQQAGRSGAAATIAWSGTFHGIGARLLREFAPRIGLSVDFTIHDREDSADLMNLVRHELAFSAKEKRFPLKGTCLAIYSAVVNTGSNLPDVLASTFPWCAEWEEDLRSLFLAYVDSKQAQGVLDYDDLLLYWSRMVGEAGIAAELNDRFSHVLIDEYQDTNLLQAAILLGMKPDGRGVTVVGDDAQAIYSFRGATVRNILDFPAAFDPPARQVTLERNYRSTTAVLTAANAVIALARERYTKDLWTDRPGAHKPRLVTVRDDADQAGYVVERLLAHREDGLALKSQAVLFRAAQHSARLEVELTRRNIPYTKFGGLKFLEAAHVKDVIALARWAVNPRDRVAGFRAIQLLEGMGPRSAARVLDQVAAAPGDGASLQACGTHPEDPDWKQFADVVQSLRATSTWPAPFEHACAWYEEPLERRYEDAAVRRLDIQQLARIAATSPSLQSFLTDLTLDPPEATSDEAGVPLLDEDYLILSTIHSAKGKEWNAVTLLNVVDGCLPSDLATGTSAQLEEERRLLYVAMTRARDHLDLVVPQRFQVGHYSSLSDRHVYAGRTRFLPERILGNFEQVTWPVVTPGAATTGSAGARIDLGARVREMWR